MKKIIIISGLIAIIALFLAGLSGTSKNSSLAQETSLTPLTGAWTKYVGNPALEDTSINGVLVDTILSDINDPLRQPIQFPHPTLGNKYWLVYGSLGVGGRIRLAYSDDLLKWKPYGTPILNLGPGENYHSSPNIYKDGDQYFLVFDIGMKDASHGETQRIAYAKSSSIFGPWTRGNIILDIGAPGEWDEGRVTEPYLFKENNQYYLYYMGDGLPPYGRAEQVGLATATAQNFASGLWQKQGVLLPIFQNTTAWDRGLTADPSVIKVNDVYYMMYTGSHADTEWKIGFATASSPLGPWTRPDKPSLIPGPSGWDLYKIVRGAIHYSGGRFYATYSGYGAMNRFLGGMAYLGSLPTPTPIPTSTPTVEPGGLITREYFVSSGSDDAFQQGSAVYLTDSKIKIGWYAATAGFRFGNSNLFELKNKQIRSAYLLFNSAVNSGVKIGQRIYLQAADYCSSFSTLSNNLTSRSLTSNSVFWQIGTASWTINARYSSPNVSLAVQEVVSRSNWNGRSLCVILKNEGSANYTERYLFSKESGQLSASLKVIYDSGMATPTPTAVVPTILPTPTATVIPTTFPTPTPTVISQPASCTGIGLSNRNPEIGVKIYPQGNAVNGAGANAITAYQFIFGDNSGTGWVNVSSWNGSAYANHAYQKSGSFLIQFLIKLQNGQILGGGGTSCAVSVTVK